MGMEGDYREDQRVNAPTVSACMPHHNYFEYIERALDSLCAQKYALQEIVILDDDSDNGDWPRLIKLWENWGDRAPVLTLRRLENNPYKSRTLRIPYVRNQAFMSLQVGTPDYIFFPDADDEWSPSYVKRCLKIMEEDPEVDFVYPNIRHVREGKINNQGDVPEFDLDRLFTQCYITCCTMMRTDAFLHAGMWPENVPKKEYIFWNTIARLGHKGKKLRGNHFFYHQHAGQRHTEFKDCGPDVNPDRHDRYNSRMLIAKKFNIPI